MRPLADGPDLTHTRPAAPPMPLHNAAWHDAQYNNRARVAEHAQFLTRWPAESAQARARLAGQLDLAYGDMPGERLDVFASAKAGAPIMVFIHGGYWRSLDKADFSFVAPPFVKAGATVVVPNYDLCPAVTIETIALQSARALAWVWRHLAQSSEGTNLQGWWWSATRPVRTLRRCCWPAVGSCWATICRCACCLARWQSPACTTWSRCATRRFCRPTCA